MLAIKSDRKKSNTVLKKNFTLMSDTDSDEDSYFDKRNSPIKSQTTTMKKFGSLSRNHNTFKSPKSKKGFGSMSSNSPRYMTNTMYGGQSTEKDKYRFKTPCERLEKRKLDTTYHDAKDPKAGGRISLNSFLGIDQRGENCLSGLRKKVSKSNLDEFGDPCGIGLLSEKYGRVDLELSMRDVQAPR